jgi:hypothetical protein
VKQTVMSPSSFVLAVLFLLGCSIDNRQPSTRLGALLPEAGSPPGEKPSLELTVVPSYVDLGAVTQGCAARARLRLSNTGSAALAAPVVSWGPTGDSDFRLVQDQCTGALAPGEQCDLRVQVVPSRAGALAGNLEISSEGASSFSVSVAANGLQAGPIVIQPAPASYQDFGGVLLGTSSERVFAISNPAPMASGVLSLSFNRPEFATLPAAEGECVPGVTELASGESCNVRVVFTPAERGALETTVSVTSTAAGSQSLTLRGQGLVPASLVVSAPLLDFGGVVPGDTAALDLEVSNGGDEPMTLAAAQLTSADASVFRIADSNCGESMLLSGGQTCRMQLDFRPTSEGQPSAGDLLVSALGGEPSQRISLQGLALTRGNLVVEAVDVGQENFGDVLLGASAARVFRVSNPTQQMSGELTLAGRNGFEVEPPSGDGVCQPGVTVLGNAQSCTVGVIFTPSSRGAKAGAVTVNSPLAGAKSLALRGRGIVTATLEADTGAADSVVDFGRVTTNSSGKQTITLRNTGDTPFQAPPELLVTASAPGQAAAFTFENGCTQPLAAGAECEVVLAFAPEAAVPYAASLDLLPAEGVRSSVLLLGEALEPGRLLLVPAEGQSPDFGDVAVGSNATRSFSVTNPGGGASGALSLGVDDSQFSVSMETCAAIGLDGLGDGESCVFDVRFAPTTNIASAARLAAKAAATGETGITLTGRGRLAAALAATTTERDLGRANIGEPSGETNQFTWTVNNSGDLPSGAPTVINDNPLDFDITVDTCSNVLVPGAGNCALTIVFSPDAPGERSARIVVTDGTSNQTVPLTVTGFGVRLSAPGEACLASTDCMDGVCTGGVCCNQECSLTCQTCETGECVEQNAEEPCGNAGGVCFGLEQCALPAGGACATSADCGGSLVCKECRTGGSQCTASDRCCGGCEAGYQCVNGECGCPLQAGGRPQLDCGAGVCAFDREGACCPNEPPLGCNCDSADNLCKECLVSAHCTEGLIGGVATCNANRTCSYSCPNNTKECNGACIPNNQCCNCAPGQECNTSNGTCGTAEGGACAASTQCLTGNCSGGRCCTAGCTSGCNAQGSCACPPGQQFVGGINQCRPTGGACDDDDDCASGCTFHYRDGDRDGFGDPDSAQGFCGSDSPSEVGVVFVEDSTDCCDLNSLVNPGQTDTFSGAISESCPRLLTSHDYNCDGVNRYRDNMGDPDWDYLCIGSDAPLEEQLAIPCVQRTGIVIPPVFLEIIGPVFITTPEGRQSANLCGNSSVQHQLCSTGIDGSCEGSTQLAPPCN